jgi:hypothetical protein
MRTHSLPTRKSYTFMKTVHIELSDERRDISVFKVLTGEANISTTLQDAKRFQGQGTDARTLENSDVGDMTKLSLVPDHEIRCWILGSSSILLSGISKGSHDTCQRGRCKV